METEDVRVASVVVDSDTKNISLGATNNTGNDLTVFLAESNSRVSIIKFALDTVITDIFRKHKIKETWSRSSLIEGSHPARNAKWGLETNLKGYKDEVLTLCHGG
jgi:hypothetical protein